MKRHTLTDYLLKDYERETLTAIRAASPLAKYLPTKTLCDAYHQWSTDSYCAGWMDHSPTHIRSFLSWAFTRPIDRF